MTSVLAEAVRELAENLGMCFELDALDSGATLGKVYVDGELVLATAPCWVVSLDGSSPFKDYHAAMLYVQIVGHMEDCMPRVGEGPEPIRIRVEDE